MENFYNLTILSRILKLFIENKYSFDDQKKIPHCFRISCWLGSHMSEVVTVRVCQFCVYIRPIKKTRKLWGPLMLRQGQAQIETRNKSFHGEAFRKCPSPLLHFTCLAYFLKPFSYFIVSFIYICIGLTKL